MRIIFYPVTVVLLVACVFADVAAATPAAGADSVDKLIYEFNDISRDLHKLKTTQVALVQQKDAIDATGAGLGKQEDALNQQEQAHNQQADTQKKSLAQNQSECNDQDVAGKNTAQHVNDCDNAIKKLNAQTVAIDAGTTPLQNQQSSLELAYGQYNQTANDWNVQEQENSTALNSVYRALNDWADQADDLITSGSFQDEVYANHAEKYCLHNPLPDGMITVEQLEKYSNGADRCLKSIAALRRAAHANQ